MPRLAEYRWLRGLCTASASFSTATSGEGRSGLPKPRSMTSRPSRRATAFRSLMVANTYGGSPLIRRNSMAPRLLPDSPADAHPDPGWSCAGVGRACSRCRARVSRCGRPQPVPGRVSRCRGGGQPVPGGQPRCRASSTARARLSSDSGQAQTAQVAPAAASSPSRRRDLRHRPAHRSAPGDLHPARRQLGHAEWARPSHRFTATPRSRASSTVLGSPPPDPHRDAQIPPRPSTRPQQPRDRRSSADSNGTPKAWFSGRLRWSPVPSRRSSGPC